LKLLNLACGPIYVADGNWVNLDYVSNSPCVRQCNLLKSLPFDDNTFDLVYSSHFFEHIPRSRSQSFLAECYRVLKPGGVLRLVLPDCEEMFSTYLDLRRNNKHKEADLLVIEIIDQSVRAFPGGELLKFYQSINLMSNSDQRYWREFIFWRNGETLEDYMTKSSQNCTKTSIKLSRSKLQIFNRCYRAVRLLLGLNQGFLSNLRQHLALMLINPDFKEQNISLAGIGERHLWLWDFYQLQDSMERANFTGVSRVFHDTSGFHNFPFFPLDAALDGRPRKGAESMFVEACKASQPGPLCSKFN